MEFGQFLATLTAINGIWSVPLLLQQLMEFGQFLATLTAINGIWSVPINGIWSVPHYSYSN